LLRSGGTTDSDLLPSIAVCEAVAVVGAGRPELLNSRLIDPLMDLLGVPDATLRRKAATALSNFLDPTVAKRLGDLIIESPSREQRFAAVEALAGRLDQRFFVEQLVRALGTEDAELRSRIVAALQPATRRDLGSSVEAWKAWWASKQTLDELGWLQDRVELFRQQNQQLRQANETLRTEGARRVGMLVERLTELLKTTYRLTPQPQKDDLLVRWLQDALPEYRSAALGLIAQNISDGNQPAEAVRTAIRARFTDDSPDLRRTAFDLVGALTDPADAQPVCDRLREDRDPTVREAILRALGRLQNPVAIAPLVAELTDAQAPEGCVAEAAISLGLLATQGQIDRTRMTPAIVPLKERFASAAPASLRLRAALLGAMANVGASEFSAEFAANLDAPEPDLLLPALQGVRTLADASRIDRVVALLANADPRVRRRAAETLGTIGSDRVHIEALAVRLNPATEQNEGVRQAAWAGFRRLTSLQPISERLQWVDRLKDAPDQEITYLSDLVGELALSKPTPPELNNARRRLARLCDAQGRHAEALTVWRDLWQALEKDNAPETAEAGLELLRATLTTSRLEKLDELVVRITAVLDDFERQEAARMILDHAAVLEATGAEAELRQLLEVLSNLPADTFDAEFRAGLEDLRTRPVTSTNPASQP